MATEDLRQDFFLTIGPGGPAMHRLVEEELWRELGVACERWGQAVTRGNGSKRSG